MNDIIKIIKSLENVSVLIDGATETVKHELKTKKWLFCYLVCTFGCFISTTHDFFSGKRY